MKEKIPFEDKKFFIVNIDWAIDGLKWILQRLIFVLKKIDTLLDK